MTVTLPTIEDSDLVNKGVLGQADTPGISTEEMQIKVEEIPRAVIVPKFKDLVTALISTFATVYNKTETDAQIDSRIVEIGAGDMAKAVYDTDNDGIVDNAERLGGKLPTEFVEPATSPTENNFAALTADGKIKDSGKKASDFSEWKNITVPTPSVSGNVRTYTFDMTGKNENEIGVLIFANGYSALDMRILPAPYAFAYSVIYQDSNLTSRTIVTVSISGENLTIAVNSDYLSTSGAYSVIGMFLWR